MSPELASAIVSVAKRNNWNPVDLGTVISYETGGTLDPWKAGPTTQWGQHRGLIQWGEPQAKQYGVHKDMSVTDQMNAVEKYLLDRGLKPGAGRMDMYSTINAGAPGLSHRSDANNGGAPGTVADKVNNQMAGHDAIARKLLGLDGGPVGSLARDPTNPANPTQTAAVAPVPTVPIAPDVAAPAGGTVGALASALNPAGQAQQPVPVEYAPLQQIQMAQPQIAQSQQIAAALAKAYGLGA